MSSGLAKKFGIATDTVRHALVHVVYARSVHDEVVFEVSLSLSLSLFAVASFDAAPPREKPGNVDAAGAVAFDAGAGVLDLVPNNPPPRRPPPEGAAVVAVADAVELAGVAAVGAEPNKPPEGAAAGAICSNVGK